MSAKDWNRVILIGAGAALAVILFHGCKSCQGRLASFAELPSNTAEPGTVPATDASIPSYATFNLATLGAQNVGFIPNPASALPGQGSYGGYYLD